MMRLIPPIAVPLGLSDVASSVARGGADDARAFAQRLAALCGFERADLFGSGRAGLSEYLRCVARPVRDEVVVPAYTCWSVPSAVVRAGLRVRLVDVDPVTMDFDRDDLASAVGSRTACVVAVHLFARSSDLDAAARVVAGHERIPILEDAAQAWPGARSVRADAALLSFGRGKPLALGGGGALLHDGERLRTPIRSGGGWSAAATLAATAWLGRPSLFRVPESLPFLGIGETKFEVDFDSSTPFFAWQSLLGLRALPQLPAHALRRTQHARRILASLEAGSGWTIAHPARQEGPIRLPLLAPTRAERDSVLRSLRRLGVSASAMYPGALTEVSGLRPHLANPEGTFPGATALADRLLTLPTYPTLAEGDVERIINAFRAALQQGARC